MHSPSRPRGSGAQAAGSFGPFLSIREALPKRVVWDRGNVPRETFTALGSNALFQGNESRVTVAPGPEMGRWYSSDLKTGNVPRETSPRPLGPSSAQDGSN